MRKNNLLSAMKMPLEALEALEELQAIIKEETSLALTKPQVVSAALIHLLKSKKSGKSII